MEAMLVTSDVSKLLSVWLNAYANCRVTTQGEGVQCGASAGREAEELLGASVAAQSGVHGEGPTQKAWGAGHERTENMEPMLVTLEVSKLLSGWLNEWALCRVERRACDAVWAGREAAGCVGRWQR